MFDLSFKIEKIKYYLKKLNFLCLWIYNFSILNVVNICYLNKKT